jgi:hypothetical protein
MSQAGRKTALTRIEASLLSLEKLNICFRGPFETPRGKHILLVEDCILTQAEIMELQESGMLNAENIGRLLRDLKRIQRMDSRNFSS